MDAILAAWRLTASLHDGMGAAATVQQLDEAERMLGRPLPLQLREVYEFSNGIGVLGGNTVFDSLDRLARPGESAADTFRNAGWPIPDEVVMFGGDGSDGLFGLWLPAGTERRESAPVVAVGEIFEEGCMDVAGTGIAAFLAARTAYYLVAYMDAADTSEALDVLGVPAEFRTEEPDEQTFVRIHAWADPELPGPPDPYEARLTPDDLRSMFTPSPPRG